MKKYKKLALIIIIGIFYGVFIKNNAYGNEILPEKYDLRNVDGKSYVTTSRNQGRAGSCWAFSAMASLESAIMKENKGVVISDDKEKSTGIDFIDLSEDHMDRNHGYDYTPKKGGRYECAVSYLINRNGPYLEKDFPFGDIDKNGAYNMPVEKQGTKEKIPYFVQGVKFIEDIDVQKFLDKEDMLGKIDSTKKAIIDYGAVSTNIYQSHDGRKTFPYTNEEYYNKDTFAYYCDGQDGKYDKKPNHSITIIGWDDNFKKENFKTQPKYDGAWICKESQGNSFGDNGFYYVSYESVSCTTTQYCFSEVKKSNETFKGIAQHDKLGLTRFMENNFSSSSGNDTYFNVFNSEENCELEAVGFYSMGNSVQYKIYIIEDFNDFSREIQQGNDFDKFKDRYLKEVGISRNPGYNTINLKEKLKLSKNQKYAIGLWIENKDNFKWSNAINGKNDYVFETRNQGGVPSNLANINNGETYVYDEEGYFNMEFEEKVLVDTSIDIPGFGMIGNLCLKGYYNINDKPIEK